MSTSCRPQYLGTASGSYAEPEACSKRRQKSVLPQYPDMRESQDWHNPAPCTARGFPWGGTPSRTTPQCDGAMLDSS